MRAWEIWTGPLFGPHPVLLVSAPSEKKELSQRRGAVTSIERRRDISRKIIQGLAVAGL